MATKPIDEIRTPFAQRTDSDQILGPGRIWCVRIMLPGHSDPDLRTATAFPMDGIVEEILEDIPALAAVEQLTAPGAIQQEHFLVGYSNDRNHERAIEKALGNQGKPVTAYGEGASATPTTKGRAPSSIASKMHEIVKSGIPDNIKTQLCQVDLTPLGLLPRPTSRVLLAENMHLTRIDTVGQSAIVSLVRTLNARRMPYLHGTLLTRAGSSGSHDYLGASRLVVFGTDNGIVTDDDVRTYAETVDEDFRISTYFDTHVRDNFDLPVESHHTYATNATSHPSPVEQMDDQSIRQTTIRDLQSGFTEYRSLFNGQMNADQRYRQLFGCYGVLRLRSCDLINFFAVIPAYFDVSPWGRAMTASPIEVSVVDFDEPLAGTRHSFGTEHPGDTTRSLQNTNEESIPHQELVSDWALSLIRNGHEILAIDQDDVDIDFPEDEDPTETTFFDDASRPDIVSRKDGRIHCHEIEYGNKTKPAKLLTNLARAVTHGYSVIIVTPSRGDARQKYINENDPDRLGPLLESYRDVDANGVICYTLNATVQPSEDVTMLLPSGTDTSRWRRTPDDRHELIVDGDVVAEGPADESVDTYSYTCPRVYERGSGYVLESASGEVIREQPTKDAASGDLTPIRKPFPILKRHHLTQTTVMYKSGDQFTEFAYQPEWALTYQSSNSRRYEAAANAFIEQMTVESDGDTIRLQTLRQVFLKWYTAQTDLNSPNDTWFGRAVNASYDVDDSDTHNKRLENRTFRFSNDVVSPDLPFVDDEGDIDM